MGIALVLVGVLAIWGLSGFFRVQSEELASCCASASMCVTWQPGLNYHLALSDRDVLLPKALRGLHAPIGMR